MRPYRQTSTEAHESIKPAKQYFYDRIIDALRKLKVGGTAEEIAFASGLKHDQTCKRMSELIEMGKVYNVGITRKTTSGRQALVRQLVELKQGNQLRLL